MLYTYECPNHGDFDRIFSISEMESDTPCPLCGNKSKKVIVLGHGGLHRRDKGMTWVKDVSKMFEIDGHRPMETIGDLRRFYKENPTIKPAESHPAFPSSIGDCSRPPDEATAKKNRSKQAHALIRKGRALTVNSGTSA